MALVLVHDNAEVAEENVASFQQIIDEGHSLVLRRPWKDLIDEAVLRTEGRVLLAKLRGERIAQHWLTWYSQGDLLIPHE